MTKGNKVIQFPGTSQVGPIEIDGIVIQALFFDGNRLWVDVFHRSPNGKLYNINPKPVDLGPGSSITINLSTKPLKGGE